MTPPTVAEALAWALDCKGINIKTANEARLVVLAEEVDRLRADAARLDWLGTWDDGFYNIDRISCVNERFNGFVALRAAIDAARKVSA